MPEHHHEYMFPTYMECTLHKQHQTVLLQMDGHIYEHKHKLS